jgi:hypothetical protein
MTQRERHGIAFTVCPECKQEFGTRGLARHRKSAHGVQPATMAKKVSAVPADRAARLNALRESGLI